MPCICYSKLFRERETKFFVKLRTSTFTTQNFSKPINVINQYAELRFMKNFSNTVMEILVVFICHEFKNLRVMIEIFDKLLQCDGNISVEKEKHQLFQRNINFMTRF